MIFLAGKERKEGETFVSMSDDLARGAGNRSLEAQIKHPNGHKYYFPSSGCGRLSVLDEAIPPRFT